MNEARLTLVGSGASMGVPMIGCQCKVCQSDDPFNHRTRSAALIEWEGRCLLIDAGPDVRQQMLRNQIDSLDGLILTHSHYDHMSGIDELRAFYYLQKEPIPCLLSPETLSEMRTQFGYLFHEERDGSYVTPHFQFHAVPEERGKVDFLGRPVSYFSYEQAKMRVLGLRFGDLAYVTDIYRFPPTLLEDLKGVRLLLLSALRFTPSPVHLSIDQAIELAREVGAEKTYFIHIAHDLDHRRTNRMLPDGIALGYDGLELEFQWQ
jgi:phosphoribosyl 1,2-cyclic phosphate phosphodiesterase